MSWLLQNGVSGLFVTGTYGSGHLMTPQERVCVYEAAAAVSRRSPGSFVIAHVGSASLTDTLFLTERAAALGLDAVAALAVLPANAAVRIGSAAGEIAGGGQTEATMLAYYRAIQKSAGELPVYAYNNPEVTGFSVSCELVSALQSLGIAGIKDSTASFLLAEHIRRSNDLCLRGEEASANGASVKPLSGGFRYISGTSTGWPEFRRMGWDTLISGMANYAPELVAAMYRASFLDYETAERVYREVDAVKSSVKFGGGTASAHIMLAARGRRPGFPRPPILADYDRWQSSAAEAAHRIAELTATLQR